MFCPNCGATVEGRFCAKCGTAVEAGAASSGPAAAGPATGAQPYSAPGATSGGMTDNVASALCYALGIITGILFLVLAPYNQNKLIRFHAFQSIFLNAAWIVFWIVETMIAIVMPWYVMTVVSLIGLLVALGFLALWLVLMFKAYNNEKLKLPIIGDLAEKQA
jgi:uncharacterized membrane protein